MPSFFLPVSFLFSALALAVSLSLPSFPLLVIFQVRSILIGTLLRMDWIIASVRRFLRPPPPPRLLGPVNSLPGALPPTHFQDAKTTDESCNDYDHYDVFLNHRGPDVKRDFAAHLEDALISAGFHPFLDKSSVKKGDYALRAIDHGLNGSDVHVAIVSPGYAESKYCLNELVDMLASGKPIIPVFYGVEPQHLRHELVSGPFRSAFEKHMAKGRQKEVQQWVDALYKLADRMAFRSGDYADHATLKHEIVEEVKRLLPSNSKVPVGKHRVSLKSSTLFCIQKLEEMGPNCSGALILTGMGGVGKTTLCEGIYNFYAHKKKFRSMTFLRDIRSAFPDSASGLQVGLGRRGQVELQNQLLWDLLRVKDPTFRVDYNSWFQKLSRRLGPVLIVLDNVDSRDQFEQLIPDVTHLRPGSRVILTSRVKNLLTSYSIPREFSTYEHAVQHLESSASRNLFNLHAFGERTAPAEFQDVATKVADACHGLPLALKVVGSSLAGRRANEDRGAIWAEAVAFLKENADVMRVLQWSYDCLPSKSEKLMFLDIACIIHKFDKTSALNCWEDCKECTVCPGFRNPRSSLQCLFERCLIEEDAKHLLVVHDLLQDMAKKIVREQAEGEPRRQSHQFDAGVAEEIVAEKKGTENIRGLTLAGSRKRKFAANDFKNMDKLHFLVLDGCSVTGDLKGFPKNLCSLQWRNMPHPQIPPTLNLPSLSVLDLSQSSALMELWSNPKLPNPKRPMQHFSSLRTLKMSACCSIMALPESIGDLFKLDQLDLSSCTSLTNLPESIGQLKALLNLTLHSCESLETLPSSIGVLTNLKNLELSNCKQLRSLPDSLGQLTSLLELNLTSSTLTELPESFGSLCNLRRLDFHNSPNLVSESFPDTLCKLTGLREIEFGNCTSLWEMPSFLEELCHLDYLGLDNCYLDVEFPTYFTGNTGLRILSLLNNTVTCLPEIVTHLPHLEEVHLDEDMVDFTKAPEEFVIEHDAAREAKILRKKTLFSLDTESDGLPTD